MKRTFFAVAALAALFAMPAAAQTGLGIGQSQSQSGAAAFAGNQLIFNQPGLVTTKQKGRVDTTASALAPALAASAVETCLGSRSAGVGVTGLGLSFGSTYLEEGCESRAVAKLLAQMGAKREAVTALCANPIAYDSLVSNGFACPFGRGNHYAAPAAPAQVQAVAAVRPAVAPSGRVYSATPWRD